MEIIYTENPLGDVPAYILKTFPYSPLMLVGQAENLISPLEKQGNKVFNNPSSVPENVRFILVVGGDEEAEYLEERALPVIFLSTGVPLNAVNKTIFNGNRIMESKSPKLLFIDISEGEYEFQKSVFTLALGLYLEAIGIAGSGLKSKREERAFKIAGELKVKLNEFWTNREMLDYITCGIEELGGLEFYSAFNFLSLAREPKDRLRFCFYGIFCFLYLIKWFTNIDFCVILPYMDVVRHRILCDLHGIRQNKTPFEGNPSYQLSLIKDLLPEKEALSNYLNQFWLIAGRKSVAFDGVLSDMTIATEIIKKPTLLSTLVQSGYMDCLS